jgi:two-component system chemotaxis sensor kinase CheA
MADEMLGEFLHEATEHLANAAGLLLTLAKAPTVDAEALNACFRALHTVKGCAGFLDLHRIKGLAHAGEQVLDALRAGDLTATIATWDILLATVTRLEEHLAALERDQVEPAGSDQDVITTLEGVLIAPAPANPDGSSAIIAREHPGVRPAPVVSLDACVARIIAGDLEDAVGIRQQVERIAALAAAQGWTGPRQVAVMALAEAAARLDGADRSTAQCDLFVHLKEVQDLASGDASPVGRDLTRREAKPSTATIRASGVFNPVVAPGGVVSDRSPELMRDFANESSELLAVAEGAVLGRTTFDGEQINAIFRTFHTIKGMAAYLEQPQIEHAAHAIEERLLPVRDGQQPADATFIQIVLGGVDQIRSLVAGLHQPAPTAELLPDIPQLADLLMDMGVPPEVIHETAKILKPNEDLGEKLVATGRVSRQVVEQAAQQQAAQQQAAARAGASDGFSRVATSKLEEMVNMVGELLIAQAMVVHDPDLARFANLAAAVQRQSRILRSLQVLSLSLRMVPLRATFQKMARAVHDTARKLGKQIDYQTAGEDTEIDRTLAEAMADPLMHMVRNAVDHGIEPGEARTGQGKSATGTVKLEAFHAGDNVVIQLTDDGAGMDPQRLRKKAVEKGLIPADRVMTDAECFDLVFLPGFSTAAKVTDVSGRGVGMDVVRRQVRQANGAVQIQSAVGKGSVFTIRLPLTTAIMDTMLLRVGEERFLIPVSSVVSMLRPADGQVSSVMTHGRVLNNRGRELPVIRLGEFFAISDHQADPQQSLLLVVENRGRDFALQVDEVLGQRQVVIKPFDHALTHHPGVSGSAILGDGRVALILNPAKLLPGGGDEPA